MRCVGSLGLTVLIGVVVLAIRFVPLRPMGHKMAVKAYFTSAMGLRAGAPVRFAGVDLRSVKSVRAKPEVLTTEQFIERLSEALGKKNRDG